MNLFKGWIFKDVVFLLNAFILGIATPFSIGSQLPISPVRKDCFGLGTLGLEGSKSPQNIGFSL
jgi:hypothetical protein